MELVEAPPKTVRTPKVPLFIKDEIARSPEFTLIFDLIFEFQSNDSSTRDSSTLSLMTLGSAASNDTSVSAMSTSSSSGNER